MGGGSPDEIDHREKLVPFKPLEDLDNNQVNPLFVGTSFDPPGADGFGVFGGADMELNFGIRGFALFLWSHRRNDVAPGLQGGAGVGFGGGVGEVGRTQADLR